MLAALLCIGQPCLVQTPGVTGHWFETPPNWVYADQSELKNIGLIPVARLNKTGGHYFYETNFDVGAPETLAVDFKNASVIGHFYQHLVDSRNRLVAEAEGGMQSGFLKPFFLASRPRDYIAIRTLPRLILAT